MRRFVISLLLAFMVIVITVGLVVFIQMTEPSAKKSGATRKSAALVETVIAELGNFHPEILALGTVEPAKEIMLSSRVSGQVLEISSGLIPGGFVKKGDLLLKIDPADFQTTLDMRQSELHQAEAALQVELGRQNVARQEFEFLGEEIDSTNRALILREPQIESARAVVEAAKAAVANAELNLAWTKVYVPFDAQILTRNVNVGSQVTTGDTVANLVGIDTYWIIATVPIRYLGWIKIPGKADIGSPVTIRKPEVWGANITREGRVEQLIGKLDDQTRMARLLITIEDPLARNLKGPSLLIGMVVETSISGRLLENVYRLNRDIVRKGDTVWVLKDGKLEVRDVNIVYSDVNYAYIDEGIESGERIVVTNLATVANGILLREKDDSTEKGFEP